MNMFQFHGFTPSAPIRVKANRLLGRLQGEAPSDTKLTATLTWDGEGYTTTVEIHSIRYPVSVTATHWNAGISIDKAELALARKLEKHGVRFEAGAPTPQRAPAGASA